MTDQQLQAIKERIENASMGPWKVVKSEENGTQIGTTWEHGQLDACLPIVTTAHGIGSVTVYMRDGDAEFIANAREDVPALVVEAEQLRDALTAVNETIGKYLKMYHYPVYEQMEKALEASK